MGAGLPSIYVWVVWGWSCIAKNVGGEGEKDSGAPAADSVQQACSLTVAACDHAIKAAAGAATRVQKDLGQVRLSLVSIGQQSRHCRSLLHLWFGLNILAIWN